MWTKEEELEGTIYNHPKKEEGYNDDNVYTQPYRHITNWFLSKPGYEDKIRKPMPKDYAKFAGINLYGELEPHLNYPERNPNIKVVVSKIKYWMFDRHRVDRGLWILSENGWYRLKKCSSEVVKQMNGVEISQSDLHDIFNAKVGLLSCIIDMLSDHRGYIKPSLVEFHSRLSPEESYTKLCPSPTQLAQNPSLNTKPFDLKLLKLDPSFVMHNLQNLDTILSNDCAFMKGLQKLKRSSNLYNRKIRWKKSDFKASSKLSEQLCCRQPWGEQIFDENGEWYNKMFKLSTITLNTSITSSPDGNGCDTNVDFSVVILSKRLEALKKRRKDSESNIGENDSNFIQGRKKVQKPNTLLSSFITESKRKDLEKELEKYLEPNTGTIQESVIAEFIKNIIYSGITTPESKLLSIDILRKSSIDVKKKLFDTNNTGESGVKGIFILWLDELMQKISTRRHDSNRMKDERIENEVVQSILKLLMSFVFIKKKSQIAKIRDIFDVDLCLCVEKIQKVAKEDNDQNMEKMCLSAKSFLNNIQRNPTKKIRSSTDPAKFVKKQALSGRTKIDDETNETFSLENTNKQASFIPAKSTEIKFEEPSHKYSKKRFSPRKTAEVEREYSSPAFAKKTKMSIEKSALSVGSVEKSIETSSTKSVKQQVSSVSTKTIKATKEKVWQNKEPNIQRKDNSIHSKTAPNLIHQRKKVVEHCNGKSERSKQEGNTLFFNRKKSNREELKIKEHNSNNLLVTSSKLSITDQVLHDDSNTKLPPSMETTGDYNGENTKSSDKSKNKQTQILKVFPHKSKLESQKDENKKQCNEIMKNEYNSRNQGILSLTKSENKATNDSSNTSKNECKSKKPLSPLVHKNITHTKHEIETKYTERREKISEHDSNLANEDDSSETEDLITQDKFAQYYRLLALEAAKRKMMSNKILDGNEHIEENEEIMEKTDNYGEIKEDDIQDLDGDFEGSQVLVGDMLSCFDSADEDEYVDVNL